MQIESARRSNVVRSATMRARLLAAARRLFVSKGYALTSTPAIVEEAGVTRGALYHHFPDKQAIFRAVVTAESAAVADMIGADDSPDTPAFDRLVLGARAYIEAMREDGRAQLLLVEGPAILGRETIHQIEAQHGDAALKIGLQEAIATGALPDLAIDTLVSLLSAMFERAAMEVTDGTAVSDILDVIETIIGGLALMKGGGQS